MKKRKTILRICIIGIVIGIVIHSSTSGILQLMTKRKLQTYSNNQLNSIPDDTKDSLIDNKVHRSKTLKRISTTTDVSSKIPEVVSKIQNVTQAVPHNVKRNPQQIHTSKIDSKEKHLTIRKAPVNRIAFLKVHKSASSTAQNIFLRYGFMRSLNFVLPIIPNRSWPNIISTINTINDRNIMPRPVNGTFDILCCHVIYNNEAFRKYMPSDTAFIGIVREPFDHFQSVLRYFRPTHITSIKTKHPVSEYLRQPWIYEPRYTSPYISFTNNRMALEFGFPVKLLETRNKTEIQRYLKKISKEFLVVLVVEYFDESILLMKRLLGWSLKDILYIKRNVSPKLAEFYTRQPGDRENYHFWGSLDYALYDFFFTKLWQQIKEEGPNFYEELLHFKRIRSRVEDFCVHGDSKSIFVVNDSPWNQKFYVNNLDCNVMLLHEMKFVEYLRSIQYPKFAFTPSTTTDGHVSNKSTKTSNLQTSPLTY